MMRQPTEAEAQFAWYYAALKFGAGSPQAPIHADQPQAGFFRLKTKSGAFLPAYIAWEQPLDLETGELAGDERPVCCIGHVVRDAYEAWTWLAGKPVAYDRFKEAWDTGRWPDEAPGENFTAADSFEGLQDQLDAMLAHVPEFKVIDSQLACDQAANLKDRLLACHKALEAMRIAEKRPFDEGAKAVQEKFLPVLGVARDAADELRIAMGPWLLRVEQAIKAAAPQGAEPEVRARAGGMEAKRTSLRKNKVAIIVDYEAALAAVKNRDEVRAVVQKVVTALVKAGATVPGVEIKEEARVI